MVYSQNNNRFAIIDLGSNSCRLLIAEATGDSSNYKVIHSFSRIVRLAEGLSDSNLLSDEAQERTMEVLKECCNRLTRYRPAVTRFITTQACRYASNGQEFINNVNQRFGIDLEIIDEIEEARLSLLGCYQMLNLERDYAIVFDVGGASTELIYAKKQGNGFQLINSISVPYGVLTISETYGNYIFTIFDDMCTSLSKKYQKFCHDNGIENIDPSNLQIIGCSGTATSLATISLGLENYDREKVNGNELSIDSIKNIKKELDKKLDSKEMRYYINNTFLGRQELVVAGIIIVSAIMKCFEKDSFIVADRGVRDGLLYDLYKKYIVID